MIAKGISCDMLQAFVDNQTTCLKVQSRHVEKIVAQISERREQVPEYLELLHAIVKIIGPEITLRRNQTYIIKHLMRAFGRIAPHFNETPEYRSVLISYFN